MQSYDIRDRAAVVAAFGKFIADSVIKELNSGMPPPLRNCLNCTHFDEPPEICAVFKARPPARIIATACDKHSDLIPF